MTTYLDQHAYVTIRNGCPLRMVQRDGFVEVTWGTNTEEFQLFLENEVLREMVELGAAALEKVDATAPTGRSA